MIGMVSAALTARIVGPPVPRSVPGGVPFIVSVVVSLFRYRYETRTRSPFPFPGTVKPASVSVTVTVPVPGTVPGTIRNRTRLPHRSVPGTVKAGDR
jgi:hypothetical protein